MSDDPKVRLWCAFCYGWGHAEDDGWIVHDDAAEAAECADRRGDRPLIWGGRFGEPNPRQEAEEA